MSLSLLTRIDNKIYISGDTRCSIDIDGVQFAFANDTQKLFWTDNLVIFSAGKCNKYEELYRRLAKIKDLNIEEIVNQCRLIAPYNANVSYKGKVPIDIALVVASIENGIPCYYKIFQPNNYKPIKSELESFYFLGAINNNRQETQAVYDWLYNYRGDIIDLYTDFYNKYRDEGIGGAFNLLEISSKGVRPLVSQSIPDRADTKWVRFNLLNQVEYYTNGKIYANNLDDGGITSRKLDRSSVTTSKIENDAVTPAKLDRLYAEYGEFRSLKADMADIEDLVATKFKATDALISNLNTSVANIKNLTAGLAYIDINRSGTISATGIYSNGTLSGNTLFIGGKQYERKYSKDLDMYVLASKN